MAAKDKHVVLERNGFSPQNCTEIEDKRGEKARQRKESHYTNFQQRVEDTWEYKPAVCFLAKSNQVCIRTSAQMARKLQCWEISESSLGHTRERKQNRAHSQWHCQNDIFSQLSLLFCKGNLRCKPPTDRFIRIKSVNKHQTAITNETSPWDEERKCRKSRQQSRETCCIVSSVLPCDNVQQSWRKALNERKRSETVAEFRN